MTSGPTTATVVFAGGGTGGHLFPALAVADRVKQLARDRIGVSIVFVGTRRGLEYRLRESLGYPLYVIDVRGLARSFTLKNLLIPFVLVRALVQASLLLRRLSPALVIGTGGYVAWPIVRVAAARKITILLQEQNSYPGVTNRALARYAERIYLGFEGAAAHLNKRAGIVVCGNPVRPSIVSGDRDEAVRTFNLAPDKRTILVLGGSQGARAINDAVLSSLESAELDEEYQLLWQTGKRDYKEVAARAGKRVWRCSLFPFADRMELVYAAADIAIARAGALTLAELLACGVPSILIPYPHAAGDHQRRNAQDLCDRDLAVAVDEKQLSSIDILQKVIALHRSERHRCMQQAIRAWNLKQRPAADVIAEDIIALMEEAGKDGH